MPWQLTTREFLGRSVSAAPAFRCVSDEHTGQPTLLTGLATATMREGLPPLALFSPRWTRTTTSSWARRCRSTRARRSNACRHLGIRTQFVQLFSGAELDRLDRRRPIPARRRLCARGSAAGVGRDGVKRHQPRPDIPDRLAGGARELAPSGFSERCSSSARAPGTRSSESASTPSRPAPRCRRQTGSAGENRAPRGRDVRVAVADVALTELPHHLGLVSPLFPNARAEGR